jgi:hypothetical protein
MSGKSYARPAPKVSAPKHLGEDLHLIGIPVAETVLASVPYLQSSSGRTILRADFLEEDAW